MEPLMRIRISMAGLCLLYVHIMKRCNKADSQWVNNTFPAGLGEPLNIILSGDSDDDVLVQSADNGGFLNYML